MKFPFLNSLHLEVFNSDKLFMKVMCYKLMHLNLIYVKIAALKILAVVHNSLGLIFIGINNKIFVTLKYKKKLTSVHH